MTRPQTRLRRKINGTQSVRTIETTGLLRNEGVIFRFFFLFVAFLIGHRLSCIIAACTHREYVIDDARQSGLRFSNAVHIENVLETHYYIFQLFLDIIISRSKYPHFWKLFRLFKSLELYPFPNR